MMLLFSAIFGTMTVIEDRNEGFLQAVLVAAASRLALGKGAVQRVYEGVEGEVGAAQRQVASSRAEFAAESAHGLPDTVYRARKLEEGVGGVSTHLGLGGGNGGEYRKSYHGWAPGFAHELFAPSKMSITSFGLRP